MIGWSEVRGQKNLRYLQNFSFFVWFLFASDRLLRHVRHKCLGKPQATRTPKRTEPSCVWSLNEGNPRNGFFKRWLMGETPALDSSFNGGNLRNGLSRKTASLCFSRCCHRWSARCGRRLLCMNLHT